jgi:pilus assembly protein FimV
MRASQPTSQPTPFILPTLRNLSFSIGLGFATLSGHALTIGNVRGAVLVGKTVNVTVPVQLDAGDVASAVCSAVELYHADNRVDGSRVRSSWDTPGAKGEGVLRIQSTVIVDEPMVSITVRVGCTQKVERRYLLLADFPAEAVAPAVVALPVLPRVSETPGVPVGPLASAPPALTVKVPVPANKVAPAVKKVTPLATKTVVSPRPPVKAAPVATEKLPKPTEALPSNPGTSVTSATSKPRLTLEPLPASASGLKSSWELVTVPVTADSDPARAEAKALWRSLNAQNASAEDLKSTQALETQLKTLQAATAKNQATQNALKNQLAQAEEDRYTNGVVGLLAAMLVCALAGAAYLWIRMRRLGGSSAGKDWWRSESVEPSILSDLAPMQTTARSSVRGRDSGRNKSTRSPDVGLGVDESIFDSLKAKTPTVVRKVSRQTPPPDSIFSPRSGFQHSTMGAKSVNVEELFDIQQQAEFFVSLGQHEQAIELLRQHIYGATSTSGLAYLDLLQLYHKFNRRQEYDQLRDEFNHSFNAKVPPFDQFSQQNRGIERYPTAMARIEAAWKTPHATQVLQDCIFRKPEIDDTEAFDLEAYRELLLLFSIANAVVEASTGAGASGHAALRSPLDPLHDPLLDFGSVPSQFASSQLPAQSSFFDAVTRVQSDAAVLGGDAMEPGFRLPKPSPNLGLDVDLFELESMIPPPTLSLLTELPAHSPPVDLPLLDFSLSEPATMDLLSPATNKPEALQSAVLGMHSIDLDLPDFFAENPKPAAKS